MDFQHKAIQQMLQLTNQCMVKQSIFQEKPNRNEDTLVKYHQNEMISLEHRILSEYRIKIAKIETLAKFILNHREPKGEEAKGASGFLEILINETDRFYQDNSTTLSINGKRPHDRTKLPDNKEWNENIEKFYEKNPRKPRK